MAGDTNHGVQECRHSVWIATLLLLCGTAFGCNEETIFPVEVRKTDVPSAEWLPHFDADRFGYQAPDGGIIIDAVFSDITGFCSGVVGVKHGGKWYLMSDEGELVIDKTFEEFGQFSDLQEECIAVVGQKVDGQLLYGYLRHTGEYLLEPSLDAKPHGFARGYGIIQDAGRRSYIDLDGNVQGDFHRASPFFEGLAGVQPDPATGWGFINEDFEVVIEPTFSEVGRFSGGLAPAKVDGLIGFIDRHGEWVIQPSFVSAYNFREGYAPVEAEDGWVLIDKEGERVTGVMPENALTEGMSRSRSGQVRQLIGPTDRWKILQQIRRDQ